MKPPARWLIIQKFIWIFLDFFSAVKETSLGSRVQDYKSGILDVVIITNKMLS